MKRLRSLLISLMITALMAAGMPMTAFAKPDWPSDTGIESEAGIVMDADSGAVLFGQNIHVQKAPASITKILTALVVIENSSLDDTITFSHDAVYNVEDGSGNKNAIEEGDTLSVRDCLYLLLMRSSNQAANALAEHVGGSRDGFVKMMNEKTAELGCENSHFANPSGLNDDTQLTSVYDMALIASAAYKNDTLLTISKDKSYRLPATKNNPDGVTIQPEHKLLITTDTESPNYYPYAVAGKTGYTSVAGQTLVTYAIKDDRRQIAVTMKSTQATHYQDTIALMDFGFLRFKNVNISENETAYTSGDQPVQIGDNSYQPSDLSMDTSAVITIPKDASFADAEKTVVTDLPEDAPQFVKDYYAYYKTPRGYHPRSLNSNGGWNVTSSLSFLNMPILQYSNEIRSAVLLVHGEKAHSRYFSETAYSKLTGDNKELLIIPGANHTDLYDRMDVIPFEKLKAFFEEYLK